MPNITEDAPQLADALQAVQLPAAWGHLRGLHSSDPALFGEAADAFAHVAHMRLLTKRLKPFKLAEFLTGLGIWDDLAAQVVSAPSDGRTRERGQMCPTVNHLIDDASPATEICRETTAPVPLRVACGVTVPVYRCSGSYWERAREHGYACPDCQQLAFTYAEAWPGEMPKSVIPPWLPLSLRQALVDVIAAAIPAAIGLTWTRAQGVLADAAAAELWLQLPARVVLDSSHDNGPNRSEENYAPIIHTADERIGASDRVLKLLRAAADAAGDSRPLLARLAPSDWERIFAETRGPNQGSKLIAATVAVTFGDPMLVVSVI